MTCGRNYVIPLMGSLNSFDTDFPVRGREDVRCVQTGAGTSSSFPYLPELRSDERLSVEVWGVGPQSQERILDIKYFCPDANRTQDQERWRLWKPL